MRELHVLGVSDEGDALLLGTTAGGKVTHRIALDDRLRQAARGQLTPPGSDRAESSLSPKEIQARLRAGASPEDIAKVAGVPVARVLPFFAPVEAERTRIIEQARLAVLHRARGPETTHALGDLVDARLREVTGLKEDSVAWTARRRGDGTWVVGISYVARGGRRHAEWQWQPAGRELTALDALATRMASDPSAPARRRRPARKTAAPARTPKAAAPARRAAATRATAKPAALKPAKAKAKAKPATVARKTATSTVKKQPTVAKAPKVAVRIKAAPVAATPTRAKAPARPVVAVRAKPKRTPKAAVPTPRRRVLEVVPDPAPTEPAAVEAAEVTARRPGARVPLPSWSEVLLGVGAAPAAGGGAPAPRSRPRRRR